MKLPCKTYFFYKRKHLDGYEYLSTPDRIPLAYFIGETLASAFCEDTLIELVRFHRYGSGETVTCLKRNSDIKVTVISSLKHE